MLDVSIILYVECGVGPCLKSPKSRSSVYGADLYLASKKRRWLVRDLKLISIGIGIVIFHENGTLIIVFRFCLH